MTNRIKGEYIVLTSTVRVLRQLEWSKSYSYCTGWPCCPVCKGIKPGHGADSLGNMPDSQGHSEDCVLHHSLQDLMKMVVGG